MEFLDEVVDIELIPFNGKVFNLAVEEDSSYVLEGIITHNCLCGSAAVQMPQDEFVGRLRGWMDGTQAWDGMDGYAEWIGLSNVSADRSALVSFSMTVGVADSLVRWLWGDEDALKAAVRRNLQLDLGL